MYPTMYQFFLFTMHQICNILLCDKPYRCDRCTGGRFHKALLTCMKSCDFKYSRWRVSNWCHSQVRLFPSQNTRRVKRKPTGMLRFNLASGSRFKVQSSSLYFNIIHIKSNIWFISNIRMIQDKNDIGEMAKGKIGLKRPSPIWA